MGDVILEGILNDLVSLVCSPTQLLEKCRQRLGALPKADSDDVGRVESLCDRIRDTDVDAAEAWTAIKDEINSIYGGIDTVVGAPAHPAIDERRASTLGHGDVPAQPTHRSGAMSRFGHSRLCSPPRSRRGELNRWP